jgi:hypothetical protein
MFGHLTKHQGMPFGKPPLSQNSQPGEFLKNGKKTKNCYSQSFPKILGHSF